MNDLDNNSDVEWQNKDNILQVMGGGGHCGSDRDVQFLLEDSRRQERDLLAEWQCYEEEKCRDPEEQEAKPRHRFNLFQGLMEGW